MSLEGTVATSGWVFGNWTVTLAEGSSMGTYDKSFLLEMAGSGKPDLHTPL